MYDFIELNGCTVSVCDGLITFDNPTLHAEIDVTGIPRLRTLTDTPTDYKWSGAAVPMFDLFGEADTAPSDISLFTFDRCGLSREAVAVAVDYIFEQTEVTAFFTAYPALPCINLQLKVKSTAYAGERKDITFSMPLADNINLAYKTAEFFDQSDTNNTFVRDCTDILWRSTRRENGQMLFLSDYMAGEELAIIREAPCHTGMQNPPSGADFVIEPNRKVSAFGSGLPLEADGETYTAYSVTFGCIRADGERFAAAERMYRDYYRAGNLGTGKLYRMSNTWGDRGEGKNFSNAFIDAEINCAAKLGVDVMQIDAEWATGIMWEVNADKFKDGFGPVAEACKQKKVALGLWYVPDAADDYANWSRDADILLGHHRAWNAEYFKIDGTTLKTKKAEENYFRMVEKLIRESDGRASVNYDITASRRGGFLLNKEYGTLFVENRYTDWRNYFPHAALKTIWTLCRYLPTRRMQLELINPARNKASYGDNPLAPSNYGIDYLYAVTAFANPLIWMEMQHLSEADSALLKSAIEAFKPYDEILFNADITRLGGCPDGVTHTGLLAEASGKAYALLFGERSTERSHTYDISGYTTADIIYSGSDTEASIAYADGKLTVTYSREPSFVFAELR